MDSQARRELAAGIGSAAVPIEGPGGDWTPLLERLGRAHIVLLGEASHGSQEFYRARTILTERLIAEHGFQAVVVEADWPDAYRVNRYARGESGDATATEALGGFMRFPVWMWRNTEVGAFVEWLYEHNATARAGLPPVGFYGMDLYSLHASADAVLRYLERVDPKAAELARQRYACFEPYRADVHDYGRTAEHALEDCEPEAIRQLLDLLRQRARYLQTDGLSAEEAFFDAEQNARLVRGAEAYYRAMYRGSVESWNLRDGHMAGTVESIYAQLERRFGSARLVVWAHNSHLGDAGATSLSGEGEINLGQMIRARHGRRCFIVGFTSFEGTVTAAPRWAAPGRRMHLRPALEGSVERIFHEAGPAKFWLPLGEAAPKGLERPLLERAVGVVYRPESERLSHYFEARIAAQFDAVVHFDQTHAVRPIDAAVGVREPEPPETFPSGV